MPTPPPFRAPASGCSRGPSRWPRSRSIAHKSRKQRRQAHGTLSLSCSGTHATARLPRHHCVARLAPKALRVSSRGCARACRGRADGEPVGCRGRKRSEPDGASAPRGRHPQRARIRGASGRAGGAGLRAAARRPDARVVRRPRSSRAARRSGRDADRRGGRAARGARPVARQEHAGPAARPAWRRAASHALVRPRTPSCALA